MALFREIRFTDKNVKYRIHLVDDDDEEDPCPYKWTSEKVSLLNPETGTYYDRFLTIIEADYKKECGMKENMIPVLCTNIDEVNKIGMTAQSSATYIHIYTKNPLTKDEKILQLEWGHDKDSRWWQKHSFLDFEISDTHTGDRWHI